ncbi:hypothetical protein HA520_05240 [Azotobacter chroococcum]|uniref:Peptidase M41 domain-containing protein n=1 Tax=Azotobacter chroococcum TaxID=353 RepID=A0AA43Z4C8_9GAMM|nr:hypothetical protein [Azotobacter chroococcum]NHN76693.1 hypothetical protein [Azotobacter chroococcum]
MTHQKGGLKPAVASLGLKKARPARYLAIHEAGHALAHWWNGQPIEYAAAFAVPTADPEFQRLIMGGVVGQSFVLSAPEDCVELSDLVGRDMLVSIAGPAAQAKYGRYSLDRVLCAGGRSDEQAAFDFLGCLQGDDEDDDADWMAPFRLTVARSRELVRRYWPAIEALADLLQERGRVNGEEIEALFRTVTGESPTLRGNPLADLDKRGARHA